MKCIYFLSLVMAAVIAEEYYEVNLDNFKIEDVTANKAALLSYLQCFIEEKPCDGFEAVLKKNARNAIEKGCAKCNDEQKHMVNEFMVAFAEKLPEDYEKFKAFYDPTGELLPALLKNTAN